MGLHIAHPSPILAAFVKQYWAVEHHIPTGERTTQQIVPTGLLELTFYFGDHPQTSDHKKLVDETVTVTGQIEESYTVNAIGHLAMFSITFQPVGAMVFFNLPLNELHELVVPWRDLGNEDVNYLEDQLYRGVDFNSRVRIMENYLLEKLTRKPQLDRWRRMYDCLNNINARKARIGIEELSDLSCLSKKQFERTFNTSIGITPKRFLRIVRFQHSIHQRQKDPKITLTELAHRCGYFDQSHMNRDFRQISGMSPGEYFSLCEPYSDYFSN